MLKNMPITVEKLITETNAAKNKRKDNESNCRVIPKHTVQINAAGSKNTILNAILLFSIVFQLTGRLNKIQRFFPSKDSETLVVQDIVKKIATINGAE